MATEEEIKNIFEAMMAARKAYSETLQMEEAYFPLHLIVYAADSIEFKNYQKLIEMNDSEI